MLVYKNLISEYIDNLHYINFLLKEGNNDYSQYANYYLTFETRTQNEYSFNKKGTGELYYSTDSGITWTKYTNTISVNANSSIMFKGNLVPKQTVPSDETTNFDNGIGTFNSTNKFDVIGNPISLIYGDDFIGKKELKDNYQFAHLFYNNENISSINKLSLPATTLTTACYKGMFYGCTSLTLDTQINLLPATILTDKCYYYMFYGCDILSKTPLLPFETTAPECCYGMFSGCSSLSTTVNKLKPLSIHYKSYYYMFEKCTALTKIPVLPATEFLGEYVYTGMFKGCSSLIEITELPSLQLTDYCYSSMFNGCTLLSKTPNLLATILAKGCYQSMFNNCINLNEACELKAETLAENCYMYMFYNCKNLTYISVPNIKFIDSMSLYGMFNECTKLEIFNGDFICNEAGFECCKCMFQGCSSLTRCPNIKCQITSDDSFRHLCDGCISLVDGPTIEIPELSMNCFAFAFKGCSSLTSISLYTNNISAPSCLHNWLDGVSSTGTFYKNSSLSLPTGSSGIPNGWTVEDHNEINLITFYIDNIEYQYEEGMTWEEWINSDYNYNNYILDGSCIMNDISMCDGLYVYNNGHYIYVEGTDYIDEKNTYKFFYGGSGD